jgi:hypothetical protein
VLPCVKRYSVRSHGPIPPRGPWLASRLCCPAGSTLTTASSAPLAATRGLMHSPAGPLVHRPGSDGRRGGPQFTPCFCSFVPPSVPRGTGWVRLAGLPHPHWPSPQCDRLGIPTSPPSVLVWGVSRGCKVRLMLRPEGLLALHRQGRLLPSFRRPGSLREGVGYDYMGISHLPRPDLHRQETRH